MSKAVTHEFRANTARVKDILTTNLYGTRDIFLRETLSNASDACNKKRFQAVKQGKEVDPFYVKVIPDKTNNTLTIEDNGVGMNVTDMQNCLGEIAFSDSNAFLEAIESGADVSVIGRFGVGFYSIFLVAQYVEVFSKKYLEDTTALWTSKGDIQYTIEEAEDLGRDSGTKIVLHLKHDQLEFLEADRLKEIIKKHSAFLGIKIELFETKTVKEEVKKVTRDCAESIMMIPIEKSTITSENCEIVGSLVRPKDSASFKKDSDRWVPAEDDSAEYSVSYSNNRLKIRKGENMTSDFTKVADICKISEGKMRVSNEEGEWSDIVMSEETVYIRVSDGFLCHIVNETMTWLSPEGLDITKASEDEPTEEISVEKDVFSHINDQPALWLRNADSVTPEEYAAFYKAISNDWETYSHVCHFNVEGTVQYRAVVFIPKRAPFDLFDQRKKNTNVKLYCKQVFLMDDCEELLPDFLSFVKGVVDSDDLPISLSRESLQHSKILPSIKKQLTRRILSELEKMCENNRAEYETFFQEFGKNIKLGVHEDAANRDALSKLLLFKTSTSGDKLVTLQDYRDNMGEAKRPIYYISGASIEEVENSPCLEELRKRKIEVIYMIDPIDEYMTTQLKTFDGVDLFNVTKEKLTFGEEDDKVAEEIEKEHAGLCKVIKEKLGDKVENVVVSRRLVESPCIMVSTTYAWTSNMERIVKAQALRDSSFSSYVANKKVLEINVNNNLITQLKEKVEGDDASVTAAVNVLYNIACLFSSIPLPDPVSFARRLSKVLCNSFDSIAQLAEDPTEKKDDVVEELDQEVEKMEKLDL